MNKPINISKEYFRVKQNGKTIEVIEVYSIAKYRKEKGLKAAIDINDEELTHDVWNYVACAYCGEVKMKNYYMMNVFINMQSKVYWKLCDRKEANFIEICR